jgi:organic radical activating enzyme
VTDYDCGRTPRIAEAPDNATYTLYENCDKRIESTTLTGGEPIGFTQVGNSLQAVAGSDRIKLESGNYSWVKEPKWMPSQNSPAPASPKEQQQGMRQLLLLMFQELSPTARNVQSDSPSSTQ